VGSLALYSAYSELNNSQASMAPPDWGAAGLEDGDGADVADVAAADDDVPPGAGVVTEQAVSPARLSMAAAARTFFKMLLPVFRC
jgi:hypothetical protein